MARLMNIANLFKGKHIILYCKLYWTVKQDIPNGTSANGTRSPMRGTLPFYKLIKLQKLLLRLLYYN